MFPYALLQCVGDEFAAMMQSELALASASASPPMAAQDMELAVAELRRRLQRRPKPERIDCVVGELFVVQFEY